MKLTNLEPKIILFFMLLLALTAINQLNAQQTVTEPAPTEPPVAKPVVAKPAATKPVATKPKGSVDNGSVEDRFNFVIRESNTFENSKIVKTWWLTHLKAHVLDTIKSLSSEIKDLQNSVGTKTSRYDSLNVELQNTHEKLTKAINEKDSIAFIGIPMNKHAYNSLLWTIISGLLVLLVIFIFMFKRSNYVTVQTKKDLEDLKVEFEAFRKRALEREEKLVRKHHDEIQKYKNNSKI